MKFYFHFLSMALAAGSALAAERSSSFIYETPNEFFGRGDFDGDGRADVVIVDKETGRYRLGFQLTDGVLTWVDNRPSGDRKSVV